MIIEKTEFGRVEVKTLPLPEGLGSDYTFSGRVLVAVRQPEKGKDWYRAFTVEDDGTGICELFSGEIPQKPGANGIRWMCYADNRRVLLGDYVLECSPDLDRCESSELIDVIFPPEISKIPGIFMRWSEPIIAPDNVHVCFSSLTAGSAFNFLGRLERRENAYVMEDVSVISTIDSLIPDPQDPGYSLPQIQRGGEVKQFVRGGRGITLAGGGRSISESCLQMLDSEEVLFITDTLGYEDQRGLCRVHVSALFAKDRCWRARRCSAQRRSCDPRQIPERAVSVRHCRRAFSPLRQHRAGPYQRGALHEGGPRIYGR